MGKIQSTLESWRTGIRLGETALVIGLWASAVAASDVVIAQVLLFIGFAIGAFAIFADQSSTRRSSAMLLALLTICYLGAEGLFFWRHQTAQQQTTIIKQIDHYISPSSSISTPSVEQSKRAPAQTTYRIVVRDSAQVLTSPPELKNQDSNNKRDNLSDLSKVLARKNVGVKAEIKCSAEMGDILKEIAGFYGEGHGIAQNFGYNRNSDKIITDYNDWRNRVVNFLEHNKAKLPNYSVFELADDTTSPVPPLFKKKGYRTYATLLAKLKSLESLSQLVGSKPCDLIGKAAELDCETSGNCQSNP